jgi:lysozyme family protein
MNGGTVAEFQQAVDYVLENEGGFSDNPLDPGGTTNFGISQRSFPDIDIKNLSRQDAIDIYEKYYWAPSSFDAIQSQRVATKLFDAAVNMGAVPAVRLFQVALIHVGAGPLLADGVLGPGTVKAANAADEAKLMDEFKAQLSKYYSSLERPEFLLGWLRRAVRG